MENLEILRKSQSLIQKYRRGCHTVNKRTESTSELACLQVWNTMFCLNLPHLNLWFKVWHQSVSCRVTGTGNTRQQLPVCSADGYASHAAIGCQHHSSLNLFTNSLSGWEFPSEAFQSIHSQNRPTLLSENSKVNVDMFPCPFSLFWSIVTKKTN